MLPSENTFVYAMERALALTNILNNTDLRTGGFEQNRDDNYKDGDARVYKFSKNSKYFYAFPFNAFLNIGYRF